MTGIYVHFHTLVPSPFGTLGLVWQDRPAAPVVSRVLLPREQTSTEDLIRQTDPGSVSGTCEFVSHLARRIQGFLAGEPQVFELSLIALETCPEFQQRVLRAEHGIPRGWVSTYGRIARHLGSPGAARAVGNALANNPFPIIIPCHRAIRSDRSLGGFQGGVKMKRVLLQLEGVEISSSGKVLKQNLYY